MKRLISDCLSIFMTLLTAGTGYAQTSRVYVTNFNDSTVSVIDLNQLKKVADVVTDKNPHGVDVSPDGKWVAVSNEGSNTVSIIDATTNKVFRTISVGSYPHQLAFIVDGKKIFVVLNADHALSIITTNNWKKDTTLAVGRNLHIVLPSPAGKLAYINLETDNKLVTVDVATLKLIDEITVFSWPSIPSLSANGKTLYLSMRWLDGALVINTGKKQATHWIQLAETKTFPAEVKAAHTVKLSADGKKLLITSRIRNSVSIISTATNQLVKEIPVGTDPNWIDFTNDGKYGVVSNTGTDNVSIIDLKANRVVKPFRLAVRQSD